MVSRAVARYIRTSPRKLRLIADLVRNKSAGEAIAILRSLNKRGCIYIEELLRSAMANAKRNAGIEEGDLFISRLAVDAGPTLKRFRAASMGRAVQIRHRMSHISIELSAVPKKKVHKKEAPKKRAGLGLLKPKRSR